MPKPSEQAQIDFIVDCLRKGEQRKAILAKFGKKWQSASERTFDRRLRQAETISQDQQQRIKSIAEQSIINEAEVLKSKILTSIERQELLTKIAIGEIEIPTERPQWDKQQEKFVMIPVLELADHSTRIRAVAELNKMDGSYVPVKIAQTDKEGNDITPTITNYVIPAIGEIELKE